MWPGRISSSPPRPGTVTESTGSDSHAAFRCYDFKLQLIQPFKIRIEMTESEG